MAGRNEIRYFSIKKGDTTKSPYWKAEHKALHPNSFSSNCPICREIAARNEKHRIKVDRLNHLYQRFGKEDEEKNNA